MTVLDAARVAVGGVTIGLLAGRLLAENPSHLERLRPSYWRRIAAKMGRRGWARLAGWSACVLVLCILATSLVSLLLARLQVEVMKPEEDLMRKLGERWRWGLLVLVLGLPILEEWVFRGILMDELVRMGASRAWAVAVSALAFAAFHLSNPGAGPGIVLVVLPAGVLLGVCYLRAGLAGSILSHAFYNLVIFLSW